MLRRLHPEQPAEFAFSAANKAWAEAQVSKYPEGRQASAIIPLLWRAQEQEGWLSRPAIEHVADMLGMAYIRALEVASFYFMFQLQPVGQIAHIQVCGTTSCMICGAEDLIAVCKEKIAAKPHEISSDGALSWEEVECLGACANAPMAQIGKDYFEDLTAERFGEILDELRAGQVPLAGSQTGRFSCEPKGGTTSLLEGRGDLEKHNGSVALAASLKDTVKRIDGTEVPLTAPWLGDASKQQTKAAFKEQREASSGPSKKPATLKAPLERGADDLKKIKGVGPKLEKLLNSLGFYHFEQLAGWSTEELTWVDQNLDGFSGRAQRDNWIEQAKALNIQSETNSDLHAKNSTRSE